MAIRKIGMKLLGIDGLRKAIKRNPIFVTLEAKKFIVRGIAEYNKGIIRKPWQVGGAGGGAPVAAIQGGNLRDTHGKRITSTKGVIFPTANYAEYVHRGTSTMKKRPWLDFVKKTKDPIIIKLAEKMLQNITNELAK